METASVEEYKGESNGKAVLTAILDLVYSSSDMYLDVDYWYNRAVAWRLRESKRRERYKPDKAGLIVTRDNLALCVRLCWNQYGNHYDRFVDVGSGDMVDCSCG